MNRGVINEYSSAKRDIRQQYFDENILIMPNNSSNNYSNMSMHGMVDHPFI